MSALNFPELFELEIDGWRRGIEANHKLINSQELHNVIKEISSVFEIAIQQNYRFNLVDIAFNYSKACKGKVNPKEIAFYILSSLPHPDTFDQDGKQTLSEIVNHVDQEFGGAKDRLTKKWSQKSL